MTDMDRLAAIERKLQHLTDRQANLDCIAAHARGCDRHDAETLSDVYHEGGFDEHGVAINPGPDYHVWANAQHLRGSVQNMHHVTTHLCEIDGDAAHAESYVIGLFLNPDGVSARLIAGRYIDRLERRGDGWGIVIRRSTVEVLLSGDASILASDAFAKLGYLKGMRDKSDLSYERPLGMETGGHARW